MDLLKELEWRGLLYDKTEGLEEILASGPATGYIGFDPTASSLHVGSLIPIMGMARMQRAGHRPIALVGGGTGLIGDPSGKSQERQLLTPEKVEENKVGVRRQLSRFLEFSDSPTGALMLDNAEWLQGCGLIDFLRDVGKHFSINAMLAKESVKRRLEQDQGISFAEFSYSLLQAYDFLMLSQRWGCRLQMGGSDQWGNITAGIDLIRRISQERAAGLVFPLVVSSSGVKFGKTEEGNVWLDCERTSPFRFYQFWLNSDDRDAITYLKYFTWLGQEEIAQLESAQASAPQEREAQRRLARELTGMVHGQTEADNAVRASRVLFGGEVQGLRASQVEEIFSDVPSSDLPASRLEGEGASLTDLLAESGLVKSKGEARRLIQGGGANLNNVRVNDTGRKVDREDCIDGRFLIMRKGGKSYHLLRILD